MAILMASWLRVTVLVLDVPNADVVASPWGTTSFSDVLRRMLKHTCVYTWDGEADEIEYNTTLLNDFLRRLKGKFGDDDYAWPAMDISMRIIRSYGTLSIGLYW